ncbi:hypothetical protein J3E68DRAFT_192262 [Trichoderma sp. SZMC 28012]
MFGDEENIDPDLRADPIHKTEGECEDDTESDELPEEIPPPQPLHEGTGLHDFASYSYTSFDIYAKPDLQVMATRAIADPGASTPIADEKWIVQWPGVKYEDVQPTPVRGLNGIITLTRRATFGIYLRGETPSDGKRRWASATVQAWIARDLGPLWLIARSDLISKMKSLIYSPRLSDTRERISRTGRKIWRRLSRTLSSSSR